jgi:hypothetical protein
MARDDDDDVPHGKIDWATASVRDGRLTVEIAGDPDRDWSARLREVAERLDRPGSAWGEIAVKKSGLRVEDVAEGAEDDLRHLLESAVLQTNAEFAPDEEDDGAGGDEGGSDQDRAMTAAFRAFAEAGDRQEAAGDGGGHDGRTAEEDGAAV